MRQIYESAIEYSERVEAVQRLCVVWSINMIPRGEKWEMYTWTRWKARGKARYL